MKKISEWIDAFIADELFITQYVRADNISSPDYSPKVSVKVGKRISKTVDAIVAYGGIEEFAKLLDCDNLSIAQAAAQYLYPLYPDKCIGILQKYSASLADPIDKHKIDLMINGFAQKQPFFADMFRKLYGVEDLCVLNREK